MQFFEDVKQDVEAGRSVKVAIGIRCYNHFDLLAMEQRPPWTYVKVGVRFNGVLFEGVGFARQRQYTSLVVHRIKGFPWFKAVIARKDSWDSDVGQVIAVIRALENVVVNATRQYKRWEKGHLKLKSKEEVCG